MKASYTHRIPQREYTEIKDNNTYYIQNGAKNVNTYDYTARNMMCHNCKYISPVFCFQDYKCKEIFYDYCVNCLSKPMFRKHMRRK